MSKRNVRLHRLTAPNEKCLDRLACNGDPQSVLRLLHKIPLISQRLSSTPRGSARHEAQHAPGRPAKAYIERHPIRLEFVMADEDKEEPPMPPRQAQQMGSWVPDQVWDMPHRQRNNALYDSQPPFVPPPMEPPPPADARDDEINARFQDVLRGQAELASSIDRLRGAIAASPAAREIGPGHNQGPPLQIEELDAESKHLLALLQDKGPRPTPVDRALIAEQAEKTLQLSERIRTWLTGAVIAVGSIGAHEVTKDLTAPLWEEVARRIVDLYHAIQVWLSLLEGFLR
jgi:hypothetical protein